MLLRGLVTTTCGPCGRIAAGCQATRNQTSRQRSFSQASNIRLRRSRGRSRGPQQSPPPMPQNQHPQYYYQYPNLSPPQPVHPDLAHRQTQAPQFPAHTTWNNLGATGFNASFQGPGLRQDDVSLHQQVPTSTLPPQQQQMQQQQSQLSALSPQPTMVSTHSSVGASRASQPSNLLSNQQNHQQLQQELQTQPWFNQGIQSMHPESQQQHRN